MDKTKRRAVYLGKHLKSMQFQHYLIGNLLFSPSRHPQQPEDLPAKRNPRSAKPSVFCSTALLRRVFLSAPTFVKRQSLTAAIALTESRPHWLMMKVPGSIASRPKPFSTARGNPEDWLSRCSLHVLRWPLPCYSPWRMAGSNATNCDTA